MAAAARIKKLIIAARRLAAECEKIRFHDPVRFVYNPLLYARDSHEQYIRMYGPGEKRVIFLGMNPGPWGMAQTGVPFGEVSAVRDWMGISARILPPRKTHPRVAVTGFDCHRSEVSGKRLWGLMRERYASAGEFFRSHLVVNYCPLLFLDVSGRNLTPDKLRPSDRQALVHECDAHVRVVVETLEPRWLVGIGRFAQGRLELIQKEAGWKGATVVGIPHPSPASPLANRDWAGSVTAILTSAGVWQPGDLLTQKKISKNTLDSEKLSSTMLTTSRTISRLPHK
ncbi:MAG: uracil-DNA glycosylase family protein [Spirochaetia bacterium]